MRRIDCHVHLVGDGSSGSGCWFDLRSLYHKLLARVMLKGIGVPTETLKGGMDEAFVVRLAEQVRESSLDAVVLLAQDVPYSDDGVALPEKGGFYVPNDYLLEVCGRHPDLFLPAVSIHPGRPDAMEELEKCLAAGVAGFEVVAELFERGSDESEVSEILGADGGGWDGVVVAYGRGVVAAGDAGGVR